MDQATKHQEKLAAQVQDAQAKQQAAEAKLAQQGLDSNKAKQLLEAVSSYSQLGSLQRGLDAACPGSETSQPACPALCWQPPEQVWDADVAHDSSSSVTADNITPHWAAGLACGSVRAPSHGSLCSILISSMFPYVAVLHIAWPQLPSPVSSLPAGREAGS